MSHTTLTERLAAEAFALDMAGLRALASHVFAGVGILTGSQRGEYRQTVGEVITGELVPDEIYDAVYCPSILWPHDDAADQLAAWRAA